MTKVTVLIVEDNPMNMELCGELLKAQGYEVLQAATALEALGILSEAKPDLILMDIQLPGLSGLDLTRQLKADPKTKDIPIVALTAHAMKGDVAKIFEAGCSGYIPKPIDTRGFSKTVEGFLGK